MSQYFIAHHMTIVGLFGQKSVWQEFRHVNHMVGGKKQLLSKEF